MANNGQPVFNYDFICSFITDTLAMDEKFISDFYFAFRLPRQEKIIKSKNSNLFNF